MNKIAVIDRLPIITEYIKNVGEKLDERLENLNLNKLVCNEKCKKEIKDLRITLSKEFKEFETQRKEIKTKIMEPYEVFNETYEKEIKSKYQEADEILRNKIDEVESEMKHKKESEIRDYFEELKVSAGIDFIDFADINITINLTSSMKSLKTQTKSFVDKVVEELKTIKTQNYADEIEVEYRNTLDLNYSIQEVTNRHLALDRLNQKEESTKETVELEEQTVKKVEEVLNAPTESQIASDDFENLTIDDEIVQVKFIATGRREDLREIVKSMKERGITYESITD